MVIFNYFIKSMNEKKKYKEFMLRGKNETMTEFKNNLLKGKVNVRSESKAVDRKREKAEDTNTSSLQDLR